MENSQTQTKNEPNLDQFYCGGYFLAKRVHSLDKEVPFDEMPSSFISLSRCLTVILPDTWAIDWVVFDEKERKRKAREFGLSPYAMIKMIETVTRLFESDSIGWPGLFNDLDDCISLADKHFDNSEDIEVLGIGVHKSLSQKLISYEENSDYSSKNGIPSLVASKKALDQSGIKMGYEILGYDCGDFHSWICNSLQKDASLKFGIKVNDSGLVDNYKQALELSDYISLKGTGAEPGLWLPWAIVSY